MGFERGTVVAGRYRLEHVLGQGGMGTVWAATHTVTRRRVALKLLRGPLADQPGLRKRFLREARAASLVDHPNVVRIQDVFELDDGTPLMVMELLEGETLRALLEREGVLGVEATARLLLPVVSAVGTAHEHGVVHRDLKPENVLLTPDGTPKVLDFGIAKLHGDEGATMTAAGTVLGTPCYMAPEQGFGEPDVDQRADVWAVGVMLYEALSGGRPVEGENHGQVLKRLMEDGIAPLLAVAPDVPADVAALVDGMLVRERGDRMTDLRGAAGVLARYTDVSVREFGAVGTRVDAELEAVPDPTPAPARPQDTASPHTLPAAGNESRRFALWGAVALFLLGAVAWALWPEKPAPSATASVSPASAPATPVVGTEPAARPSAPAPVPVEVSAPEPSRRATAQTGRAPLPNAPAPSSAAPEPAAPSAQTTGTGRPPKGGLVEEPPF